MTALDQVLAGDRTVEQLASDWELRPVYLSGRPSRLAHLLSHERLAAYLRGPTFPERSFLLAYFDRYWKTGPVEEGGTVPTFQIPRADAFSAYEAGATVGVFVLEAAFPELAALCKSLRAGIGLCEDPTAAALWSPDGRGFGPHFDAIGTTILQLEGAKRWRYSTRPALKVPVSNAMLRSRTMHYFEKDETDDWENVLDEASLEEWASVTLLPGDVLHLPPGFWHTASAEGSSLAITLQTRPTRMPSFFARGLQAEHAGSAWDRVPPLLAGVEGPTPQGLAWLDARLQEAQATLDRWRDGPEALLRIIAGVVDG